MGNCLKTQLKGNVYNDNLPYFNSIQLFTKTLSNSEIQDATVQQRLVLKTNNTITIKSTGDFSTSFAGITTDPIRTITITSSDDEVSLYFSNSNYTVQILNADNLTFLSATGKTFGKPNLFSFSFSNLINAVNLNKLYLGYNTNVSGDLSQLLDLNLSEFKVRGCANIIGDISNICKDSLTFAQIGGTGISGSYENVVATFIENGRITQNCIIDDGLSLLTFNGSVQITTGTLYDASNVTYVNASKIAVIRDNSYVYTKGYTQEEAETAFAGKQIVRVDA